MPIDVTVESKIIDLTHENHDDPDARQFQKESWPARRETFKRHRNSELNVNEITPEKWFDGVLRIPLSENEDDKPEYPLMVLVDGTFAHSAAVYFAKKYIDYKKFRKAFEQKAEKIYYFSANQEGDNITRFLNYIRSIQGCEVVVKLLPKTIEQKDKKSVHPAYKSIAVDMSVVSLREAYDNPAIQHVLILSRDPETIPLIKELKDLDIKVALARSSDIPTSRSLLMEADYILNVYDLFEYFQVYSETPIKKHDETVDETTEQA